MVKRQFAKNLTTNWVVYLTAAAISFFLTPYIISRLGQGAYGIWLLVGSFSGYLGLFDFGIGYAVVRYVARYQATGESGKRNEVIAAAFYTAAALALLVLVVTVLVMIYADHIFNLPPDLVHSTRVVILLIGLSIALGFPLSVFSEALGGGLYRQDLVNIVSLSMALVRAGLVVVFLEAGWGLMGLGAAALAGSLAAYLWRMGLLFSLLPDLSVRPALMNRLVLKTIGGYSFFSFLLVFSGRIAFYSDSVVVGIFRTVEDVAVFGLAVGLTEYLRQLVFTMTRLFAPVASRYDPEKDQISLKRLFYDGSRLSLLFSLPLSAVLFFWGGDLIRLWVGGRFAYSFTILQVLLIGHLFSFSQLIGGEIMLGVGRHRRFAVLSLAAALINTALSIILIKMIGLIGVAWGTTIPLILLSVLYLPGAVLRLVGGSWKEYLKLSISPPLVAMIPAVTIIIIGAGRLTTVNSVLCWGTAAALIYVTAGYFLGLNNEERSKAKSEMGRLIGRMHRPSGRPLP